MYVEQAVTKFGSQKEVARLCEIVPSNVSNWKRRNNGRIPKHHALRLKDLASHRSVVERIVKLN